MHRACCGNKARASLLQVSCPLLSVTTTYICPWAKQDGTCVVEPHSNLPVRHLRPSPHRPPAFSLADRTASAELAGAQASIKSFSLAAARASRHKRQTRHLRLLRAPRLHWPAMAFLAPSTRSTHHHHKRAVYGSSNYSSDSVTYRPQSNRCSSCRCATVSSNARGLFLPL